MNRKVITTIAVVLTSSFLMGSSCWRNIPDPNPVGGTDCAAACTNMQKLGCPEGEPLEDGTPCAKFCEDTEKMGHAMNTPCISTATTCGTMKSDCGM